MRPQMTASGVIVPMWFLKRTHWIADLKKVEKHLNRWKGNIWYLEGDTRLFPFDTVEIYARRSIYSGDSYADVLVSLRQYCTMVDVDIICRRVQFRMGRRDV